MYASAISGDEWRGGVSKDWTVTAPTPEVLDQRLDLLDATVFTIVTVDGPTIGESHLVIGGGGGRYVVYASYDNEEFWSLQTRGQVDGMIALVCGGQSGDHPARYVVHKEQARAAGRMFLTSGELDRNQQWTRR